MTGNRALACNMSRRSPCVAAQAARVAPQNGHHRPVNAWKGHGGLRWCLKGSRTATTAVSAHKAAAVTTGPAAGHLRPSTTRPSWSRRSTARP
jgi:hypothetical protein